MVSLNIEHLISKYGNINIIKDNDRLYVVVKSEPVVLFGRIVLKKSKIIKKSEIKIDDIDYISEYKDFVVGCFNENPSNNKIMDMLHLSLAICTEAGEFGDMMKKAVFHSKPYTKSELCDEMGDIMFYMMNMVSLLGIDLRDIFMANMIKLHERYPNGRDKNYLNNVRNKKEENRRVKEFFDSISKNDVIDISYHKPINK